MYTATSSSDAINLYSPPPGATKLRRNYDEEEEKITLSKTFNVIKLNLRSIFRSRKSFKLRLSLSFSGGGLRENVI